ncbi:MAG: hypothetical protein QW356_07945 [Candidatus Hadarchaeales archaeon]
MSGYLSMSFLTTLSRISSSLSLSLSAFRASVSERTKEHLGQ